MHTDYVDVVHCSAAEVDDLAIVDARRGRAGGSPLLVEAGDEAGDDGGAGGRAGDDARAAAPRAGVDVVVVVAAGSKAARAPSRRGSAPRLPGVAGLAPYPAYRAPSHAGQR